MANKLAEIYPCIPAKLLTRLVSTYGSLAPAVLGDACSAADLGICFGADLYQREVDYLIAHEWAADAEDVLWRRTKCGLRFTAGETKKLGQHMAARGPSGHRYKRETAT